MDENKTQDLLSEESKIEISKVKLANGEMYNIKDALFRHQLNVLLGIDPPDERDK